MQHLLVFLTQHTSGRVMTGMRQMSCLLRSNLPPAPQDMLAAEPAAGWRLSVSLITGPARSIVDKEAAQHRVRPNRFAADVARSCISTAIPSGCDRLIHST